MDNLPESHCPKCGFVFKTPEGAPKKGGYVTCPGCRELCLTTGLLFVQIADTLKAPPRVVAAHRQNVFKMMKMSS